MAKQHVYNEAERETLAGRLGVAGVISPCDQVCCTLTKGANLEVRCRGARQQ